MILIAAITSTKAFAATTSPVNATPSAGSTDITAASSVTTGPVPSGVSINGAITSQNAVSTKNNVETTNFKNTPLRNSTIYGIISNAVANADAYGTGITPVTLPANGYIAFDPNGYDGTVGGVFYVTNKSGFYYPLSGVDVGTNYYSFVELDTYNNNTNASLGALNVGFNNNFNGVESENFNTANGNGTVSVRSTALFYVHDNPYAFNGGDNAGIFYNNNNALMLNGIATTTLKYVNGSLRSYNINLVGTGNSIMNGDTTIASGRVVFGSSMAVVGGRGSNGGGNGGGGGGGGVGSIR
jgi:hypothetical protein